LKVLGAERALRALTAVDAEARTLTERTFEALLGEQSVALNRDDRTHLVALGTVAPWAVAAGVAVPFEPREIERHLGRLEFLRTIGGPDLHRFIGRDDLRRRLNALWQANKSQQPVLIEGPGGVGKSMAICRFIAGLLESNDPMRRPDAVFHIDFDRLSL